MQREEPSSSRGKIIPGSQIKAAYFIAAAALLHPALTLTIFLMGRFALLPNVFDANGVGIFFATDGFSYRLESITMASILRSEGMTAWLTTPAPFHVRAYSLCFTVFGTSLGFNILSAEPLNLLCYLTILVLIFKLGREVFDRRTGLLAALMVALWPSLLLHTTQFLRDPLFIAVTLALVLTCAGWLTRDYQWRKGLVVGFAGGVLVLLLWALRPNMWGVVPAIVLLGTMLFIVRQVRERRIISGNLMGIVLLLALMACVPLFVPRPVDFMTQPNGAPVIEKQDLPSAAVGGTMLHRPPPQEPPATIWEYLWRRIDYARETFKREFPNAGSNIDTDVQFNSLGDVIGYLPRALTIGLCAPFPKMWLTAGARAGFSGRLLSGLETLTMYLIELLALVGLWQSRRRLSAWLLLLIVVVCMTAIGLVVVNVATIYRMRYVFWMLLMILGARGAIEIPAMLSKKRPEQPSPSPGGAEYE